MFGLLLNRNLLIPVIFLGLFVNSFSEERTLTEKKINDRLVLIKKAAEVFDINYKILCAIIYTERLLNYNWEDDALDLLLAEANLNSSLGFCQVKMKTAFWIENTLNDYNSTFYPSVKYVNKLKISKSKNELIANLSNDSLNILYASAYINIIINRWAKFDFCIDERPDILGTLYSTGLFYKDGTERSPNFNPQSNHFGKLVYDIYIKKYRYYK